MCGKNSLETIKLLLKKITESNTFDKNLKKIKIIHVENGQCCAELKIAEEHTNLFGTLHGGYSAHLIDMISTFALMSVGKKTPGVSVDMHVMFMRPAKVGDDVIVEANIKRGGKTFAFLDVLITNKNTGKIIVSGTHTKFINILDACDGKCTVELCVDKKHTNSRGTLHGGFSANLVDCISTYAIMTYGNQVPGVSIDLHMTYTGAAKVCDEIIVEANTISGGKTLAFIDVVIKNKNTGKIIVYGTHTKYLGV